MLLTASAVLSNYALLNLIVLIFYIYCRYILATSEEDNSVPNSYCLYIKLFIAWYIPFTSEGNPSTDKLLKSSFIKSNPSESLDKEDLDVREVPSSVLVVVSPPRATGV